MFPLRLLPAPPGGDIGQNQLFAEQAARQVGHETEQRRGFGHAGAERVGDRHIALADRLDQARHAEPRAAFQLQRIGEIGIDAPPDHVGALEAGDGADMGLPVARDEIGALDQQEAEIAGEIGLFVIGLAIGAGRVQADARIGAVGQRGEAGPEGLEEGREPPHVHLAIDGLEGARQVQAVFQRIAEAGRRLGAVVQHPPLAIRAAAEIGGVKIE